MKLTKRIITALLILAMLFVSAGCGGKDAQQSDSSTDTRQEQTKTDGKKTDSDSADVEKTTDNKDVSKPSNADPDGKATDTTQANVKDNANESGSDSKGENKSEKPMGKETVTLSIVGSKSIAPNDGVILPATDVEISDGDTVYTLLDRVCKDKGITLDVIEDGDGVFVNGIEGIVCFADGSSRAWDFTVNGRSTGRDSANSPIKGGDVIVWRYAGIWQRTAVTDSDRAGIADTEGVPRTHWPLEKFERPPNHAVRQYKKAEKKPWMALCGHPWLFLRFLLRVYRPHRREPPCLSFSHLSKQQTGGI